MLKYLVCAFMLFSLTTPLLAGQPVCQNVGNNPLWKIIKDELAQSIPTCLPHNIHLTFDDGPSAIVTPKILDELDRRNIKATFFITTTNLDSHYPNVLQTRALVNRELTSGYVVGDHGYEHNSYDLRMVNHIAEAGYSKEQRKNQINLSVSLLNQATHGAFDRQQIKLFRFPYGRGAMPSREELQAIADKGEVHFIKREYSDDNEKYRDQLSQYRRQSQAIGDIEDAGFSHLGWGHDSQDFKYSVTTDDEQSVHQFVKDNLERLCASHLPTQVALYHDIKPINAKAIPLIIDIGQCLGLNFISTQSMMINKNQLEAEQIFIPRDFQMRGIGNDLKPGLKQMATIKVPCPTCEAHGVPRPITFEKKSCLSENGKTYNHCQGESSICYNGNWVSLAEALEKGMCTPPSTSLTCISENKKIYKQCEGEDSICYNGQWISRANMLSRNICRESPNGIDYIAY